MLHPTAIVEEQVSLGRDSNIWHFCHIRKNAKIGSGCNFGMCVFVDEGVSIGNNCKLQNKVSVYRGVTIEDDVFVGPHVTFTNDLYPRAQNSSFNIIPTRVKKGASIGANATIRCGITIGEQAMIGAGSVVTRDVPPYTLVIGNPAKPAGMVTKNGRKKLSFEKSIWEMGDTIHNKKRSIPIAKPIIPEETSDDIKKILASGMIACGEQVKKFSQQFIDMLRIPHGVACNSGTAALHTSLASLDVSAGDEVITTGFTFIASGNAILFCHAKPVFVDIDPQTYNIDPTKIEEKITDKTKAILVVHLFGLPSDMEKIKAIADRHHVPIIEDCAQAHLASITIDGKKQYVGGIGDIGAYSFYPTKNMTTGEGGAVVSNSESLIKKSAVIIDQGQAEKYLHTILGYNYRLTNIAAAIGLNQLKYIHEWTKKRIENAKKLTEGLKDIPWIETPVVPENTKHVYHQYVIRINEQSVLSRDEIMSRLRDKGIGCAVHYPLVIYKQPLYQKMGINAFCPVAERASRQVLSLPVHPSLSDSDTDYIIKILETV